MSTQIAVRLEDEDLAFVDRLVTQSRAASRADAVRRALALLRRQDDARREVEVFRAVQGPLYPDLEPLHDFMRGRHPSLDD